MSDNETAKEERGPFRRLGFILASGFVAAVVVFAIAIIATNRSKSASPDTTKSAASAVPSAPAAAGCHPSDTAQQIPTSAGPAVSWSLFNGIALPSSSTAGPMVVDGDVARCYARTPAGALIAAEQIIARYQFASDWRRVTLEQVQAGAGRSAYIADHDRYGIEHPEGGYGQFAAFRFATYTPSTAVVQLVNRFHNGTYNLGTATVIWSGGDWRLQLQPDGSPSPSEETLTSIEGFVPWGGV